MHLGKLGEGLNFPTRKVPLVALPGPSQPSGPLTHPGGCGPSPAPCPARCGDPSSSLFGGPKFFGVPPPEMGKHRHSRSLLLRSPWLGWSLKMYQTSVSPTCHPGHSPTHWDPAPAGVATPPQGCRCFLGPTHCPSPPFSDRTNVPSCSGSWSLAISLPHAIIFLIKALSARDTDLHPGFLEPDYLFL